MTDLPMLSYTLYNLWNCYLWYTWSPRKVSLSGGAFPYRLCKGVLPPPSPPNTRSHARPWHFQSPVLLLHLLFKGHFTPVKFGDSWWSTIARKYYYYSRDKEIHSWIRPACSLPRRHSWGFEWLRDEPVRTSAWEATLLEELSRIHSNC